MPSRMLYNLWWGFVMAPGGFLHGEPEPLSFSWARIWFISWPALGMERRWEQVHNTSHRSDATLCEKYTSIRKQEEGVGVWSAPGTVFQPIKTLSLLSEPWLERRVDFEDSQKTEYILDIKLLFETSRASVVNGT